MVGADSKPVALPLSSSLVCVAGAAFGDFFARRADAKNPLRTNCLSLPVSPDHNATLTIAASNLPFSTA